MLQLPKHRSAPPPEPLITVLPHISAPIDEGPLYPKPPWRLRDKLLLAAVLTVLAGIVLAFAFLHANPMR